MILVTIGMSEFNFDRLFKIIDDLFEDGTLKGKKVIAQTGNTNYYSNNFETFSTISNDEFNKLVDSAEFIISHAGTGSIIPALKKGKKVIAFPRLSKYNEHIDNHQIELANLFSKDGFILLANNKEELRSRIKYIEKFKPKKFISNNDKINNLIINFIEKN